MTDMAYRGPLDQLNIESDMKNIGADSTVERKQLVDMVNLQRLENHPVKLNEKTIATIFDL